MSLSNSVEVGFSDDSLKIIAANNKVDDINNPATFSPSEKTAMTADLRIKNAQFQSDLDLAKAYGIDTTDYVNAWNALNDFMGGVLDDADLSTPANRDKYNQLLAAWQKAQDDLHAEFRKHFDNDMAQNSAAVSGAGVAASEARSVANSIQANDASVLAVASEAAKAGSIAASMAASAASDNQLARSTADKAYETGSTANSIASIAFSNAMIAAADHTTVSESKNLASLASAQASTAQSAVSAGLASLGQVTSAVTSNADTVKEAMAKVDSTGTQLANYEQGISGMAADFATTKQGLQSSLEATASGVAMVTQKVTDNDSQVASLKQDYQGFQSTVLDSNAKTSTTVTQMAGQLTATVANGGQTNLLYNSEFKNDTSGWTVTSSKGYWSNNSNDSHSGSNAYVIQEQDAPDASWRGIFSGRITLANLVPISLAVWAKILERPNEPVAMDVNYYTTDDQSVGRTGNAVSWLDLDKSGWQRIELNNITPPEGTKFISFDVLCAQNGWLALSQPMLTFASAIGPYSPDSVNQAQLALLKDQFTVGISDTAKQAQANLSLLQDQFSTTVSHLGQTNLVYNSDFKDNADGWTTGGMVYWSDYESDSHNGSHAIAVNANGITSDSWTGSNMTHRIPVRPGDIISFGVYATQLVQCDDDFAIAVNWYADENAPRFGVYAQTGDRNIVGQWQRIEFENFKVPDGAYFVDLSLWVKRNGWVAFSQPMLVHADKLGEYNADTVSQSQITQLANDINLRVRSGEVVNQINIDDSGILIDGKKVHITGQTQIDYGIIGNAQIADAAINDAKISSLSADKITAGTIDAHEVNITNINGTNIMAGSIKADTLQVGNLASVSDNLGAVKFGSLEGTEIIAANIHSKDNAFSLNADGTLIADRVVLTGKRNLIYNAEYLAGANGWDMTDTGGFVDDGNLLNGSTSIMVNRNNMSDGWHFVSSKPVKCEKGKPYSFLGKSYLWWNNGANNVGAEIEFLDANKQRTATYAARINLGATKVWQDIIYDNAVADDNAKYVHVIYSWTGAGMNIDFSQPMLVQSSYHAGYSQDGGNVLSEGYMVTSFDGFTQEGSGYYHPWTFDSGSINIGGGYVNLQASGYVTINGQAHGKVNSQGTLSPGYLKFTDENSRTYIDAEQITMSQITWSGNDAVVIDGGGVFINKGSFYADGTIYGTDYYFKSGLQAGKLIVGDYSTPHTIISYGGNDVAFKPDGLEGYTSIAVNKVKEMSLLSSKTDIKLIDPKDSLTRIMSVQEATYRYKGQDNLTVPYISGIIDDVNGVGSKQYRLPREYMDEAGKFRVDSQITNDLVGAVQAQAKQIQDLQLRMLRSELNE